MTAAQIASRASRFVWIKIRYIGITAVTAIVTSFALRVD